MYTIPLYNPGGQRNATRQTLDATLSKEDASTLTFTTLHQNLLSSQTTPAPSSTFPLIHSLCMVVTDNEITEQMLNVLHVFGQGEGWGEL